MDIILTADDFGYSMDTVVATIEALERGTVSGASIMVGMPATSAAIEFARARPDIAFGVHLVFVRDGDARPQQPADQVRSLVDSDGRFRHTNRIRIAALLGRLAARDIERELEAQITSVIAAGIPVAYVDSHRHIHKLPLFRSALGRVLPRLGIMRARGVQDLYLRPHLFSPTYWLGRSWRRRFDPAITTTDHTFMPPADTDAWPEALLDRLSQASGSLEIGVHPGIDDPWRRLEASSTRTFAARAVERGHRIIPWTDIPVVGKRLEPNHG